MAGILLEVPGPFLYLAILYSHLRRVSKLKKTMPKSYTKTSKSDLGDSNVQTGLRTTVPWQREHQPSPAMSRTLERYKTGVHILKNEQLRKH